MKKFNIKRILSAAAASAVLLSTASLLSGCDGSGDENTYEHGSLAVSFPAGNIRMAINIVALQLGFFDEEGVDITDVNIIGANALTAINEGSEELDLLTGGFVADVQALASGYDLTFIAGTAVEGGAVLAKKGNAEYYRDAETYIDVDKVINAKLGVVRNEPTWIIGRQYLMDSGVPAETIKALEDESAGTIKYYSEQSEIALALQKGEVDVGFLPMEMALLYADAYDLEIITAAANFQPNYVCCREVTSPAKLSEKKDAFIAYETARIRAFEYYKQGETDETIRERVINAVCEYSGKEYSYVETCLYGGVTTYSTDPNTVGIQKYIIAAYNSGVLSSSAVDFLTYDITQNIDTSVYKTALDNLIAREPSNSFYKELLDLYNSSN